MSPSKGAPGALDHVRAFVNTRSPDEGTDELETAAGLVAWLAERSLLSPGARASSAERERAVALREALRVVLEAHNGAPSDPAALEVLDATARAARLELRFGPEASALEPAAGGVAGALGRLLAIVAAAMADGTWPRLKACRAGTCRWAYYDHSKNRSRAWCSMEVCGNRTKVRAYRRRHKE